MSTESKQEIVVTGGDELSQATVADTVVEFTASLGSTTDADADEMNEIHSTSSETPIIQNNTPVSFSDLSPLGVSKEVTCPVGTEQFLKTQNLVAEIVLKCFTSNIPLVVDGVPVNNLVINYGKYNYLEDVVRPLSVTAIILPTGEIVPDDAGLARLSVKFNYYAGAQVGIIYGTPFPHDPRLWGTLRGNNYVRLSGKIVGPNVSGNYCGTYIAAPPATGVIEVCGKGDDAIPVVTGSATLEKGVLAFDEAVKKGRVVADKVYAELGVQNNYLVSYVSKEHYQHNRETWILTYYLNHMNLPGSVPNFYHTSVVVGVDKNGSACLLGTYPSGEILPDYSAAMCSTNQPTGNNISVKEFFAISFMIRRAS